MTRPPADDPVTTMSTAALEHWRVAHPHATLAEIEHAVDQHLREMRTALIHAVVGDAPDDRPSCPDCGRRMQGVGTRSRQLRTAQEGELSFTEPAWRCPACGAGLFPPD